MTWLSENWIWLALGFAAVLLLTGMHGHGFGMAREHGGAGSPFIHHGFTATAANLSAWDEHPTRHYAAPAVAIDPVGGQAVTPGADPVTAVYNGTLYVFENRDNRDAFEREPEKYHSNVAVTSAPAAIRSDPPRHRHHGCC